MQSMKLKIAATVAALLLSAVMLLAGIFSPAHAKTDPPEPHLFYPIESSPGCMKKTYKGMAKGGGDLDLIFCKRNAKYRPEVATPAPRITKPILSRGQCGVIADCQNPKVKGTNVFVDGIGKYEGRLFRVFFDLKNFWIVEV